jgi:para-aminobenzoate synthetase component 1
LSSKNSFRDTLNKFGAEKKPFFFCVSYDKQEFFIEHIENRDDVLFSFENSSSENSVNIQKTPISLQSYKKAFDKLQEEIKSGNTYLANLTSKTDISFENEMTLADIYNNSSAKFKLLFKDQFVCFSPERFVKIKDNKIYTFPMKGTIDASTKDAKEKILNDTKELSEHTMIVDLLRNDLSMVASKVRVEKFRYIDKIKAGDKHLLQVSSKISGELESDWIDCIGDIFDVILPAGSITGTPKKKTVEILKQVEEYDRGFFSGIFGTFDGKSLDSAVMIRFVEKTEKGFIYKSGGGITIDSDFRSEYQEMIDKVYIS